jgi:hypothetical protein
LGSAQTFAVINRIDVFCFKNVDEFKQTQSVACDGASLLKSLVLDMAANSFATKLNVLKSVVQYFVDSVNSVTGHLHRQKGKGWPYMTTDSCMHILQISSFWVLRFWAKETDSPESGLLLGKTLAANATQTTATITAARSIMETASNHASTSKSAEMCG